MSMHHTSTAVPKSIALALPPRVAYVSRRAKSTGGQSFVYAAAEVSGFRYPKLSASTSATGFWHAKASKPR
jgi:hypothetical protein